MLFADDDQLQVDAAHHWAWEASGYGWTSRPLCNSAGALGCSRSALLASDGQKLVQAIKAAVSQVVPTTTVTLGPPVAGTVWERIGTADPTRTVSQIVADSSGSPSSAANIAATRDLRTQFQGSVLFTTAADLPGFRGHLRATNVFTVDASGNKTPDYQTELWDAGLELQKRDPGDRTLYYNRRGDTRLLPFKHDHPDGPTRSDLGVAAGFLGARTDADAVEIVVKVIRGYRLVRDRATGTYYGTNGKLNFTDQEGGANTWKLFEAVAAPAIASFPPRSPDTDPPAHSAKYSDFYFSRLNRQTIAYLPTNDGMLHAFRGDNGFELYGYIPDDVLGLGANEVPGSRNTLKDLVENLVTGSNSIYNHAFFMSASPTVEDAFLRNVPGDPAGDPNDPDPGEWHTVLAFGRGFGGKFLTALDVTYPSPGDFLPPRPGAAQPGNDPLQGNWDRSFAAPARLADSGDPRTPRLLFNVGNREGTTDGVTGLPGVFEGLGETWSVPVMAPVATASSDQWVVFTGSGYGVARNAPYDTEGQQFFVLRLEDGTPYRTPLVATPVGGSVRNALVAMPAVYNRHDFDTTGPDYAQRVYIGDLHGQVWRLDCSSPDPSQWTWILFYSLGSDQPISARTALLNEPGTGNVLLYIGSGGDMRVSPSPGGTFKFAAVRDTGGPTAIPVFGGNGTDPRFSLPNRERVFVAPIVTKTAVFFGTTSVAYNLSVCRNQFASSLYAMMATTGAGGLFDVDPVAGGTQSQASLGAGKLQGMYYRQGQLYLSKSGGIDVPSETLVQGDGLFDKTITSGGYGPTTSVQLTVGSFRLSVF